MNTSQIMRALEGMKAKTIGVYAADRIPNVMMTPIAIVCNTDNHTKPDTHWVAMHIDKNRYGTCSDSYGFPPVSKYHLERLRRNCKDFRWNTKKL